jgi:hypothetical protein
MSEGLKRLRTGSSGSEMNRRFALVFAVILGVTGCGGKTTPTAPTAADTTLSSRPAPPSAAALVGNWSGSISDPVAGNGTMQLSLSQQAAAGLAATWSMTFQNGVRISGIGVADAFLPNTYGIILYVDSNPACDASSGSGASATLGFTLLNIVVTSSRLTADAARLSCSGPALGTIALSRQ